MLNARNQVTVPSQVRERLKLQAGSVLEWSEEGNNIVVRNSRKYSSLEIHQMLFPNGAPKRLSVEQMDEGIRKRMGEKFGRL
jgi:AbrB family looped-hinge helix DNA binding protein